MGRYLFNLFLSILITSAVCAKEYHVSVKGGDENNGTASKTFRTINFAAQLAKPGDVITDHEGTCREWINPARGGADDLKTTLVSTAMLGKAKMPDEKFENQDGSPFVIDQDYLGKLRIQNPIPGPFEDLQKGKFRVWQLIMNCSYLF